MLEIMRNQSKAAFRCCRIVDIFNQYGLQMRDIEAEARVWGGSTINCLVSIGKVGSVMLGSLNAIHGAARLEEEKEKQFTSLTS